MKIIELKTYSPQYFEAIHQLSDQLTAGTYDLQENYLKEIVESDNCHLFLAVEGDEVLGMLSVCIYKAPTGYRAWVEDVVVMDTARGRGLGRTLMLHAIDFAKELGVDTLTLTSNPTRVAANKLYQSMELNQRETNVYQKVF